MPELVIAEKSCPKTMKGCKYMDSGIQHACLRENIAAGNKVVITAH